MCIAARAYSTTNVHDEMQVVPTLRQTKTKKLKSLKFMDKARQGIYGGVVRKFSYPYSKNWKKVYPILPRPCAIQWAAGILGQIKAVPGQHSETMS